MERNLDAAQFVLMVCTATYHRRVTGEEEPGKGTGVRWEGSLIYNRIAYGDPAARGSSRSCCPARSPRTFPTLSGGIPTTGSRPSTSLTRASRPCTAT